jgi:hypothetical protein
MNSKSKKKIMSVLKQRQKESIDNQQSRDNSITSSDSKVLIKEKTITGKGIIYDIALICGICLLLLHIYLCYKLYSFDQNMLTPDAICLNQCHQSEWNYQIL